MLGLFANYIKKQGLPGSPDRQVSTVVTNRNWHYTTIVRDENQELNLKMLNFYVKHQVVYSQRQISYYYHGRN